MEQLDPREHRGESSNRGLTQELNDQERWHDLAILDMLSLTLDHLRGKRTLDVGIGGGKAFEQAQKAGLYYIGVDILTETDFTPTNITLQDSGDRITQLRELARKYRGRFQAADATKALPFRDNAFEVVISCIAMPEYARNAAEAVTSILEMIRVSNELVVFAGGDWNKNTNLQEGDSVAKLGPDGKFTIVKYKAPPFGTEDIGTDKYRFGFRMKDFLDSLNVFGVGYKIVQAQKRNYNQFSIHIDTSKKNQVRLNTAKEQIVSAAQSFVYNGDA